MISAGGAKKKRYLLFAIWGSSYDSIRAPERFFVAAELLVVFFRLGQKFRATRTHPPAATALFLFLHLLRCSNKNATLPSLKGRANPLEKAMVRKAATDGYIPFPGAVQKY